MIGMSHHTLVFRRRRIERAATHPRVSSSTMNC